MTIKHTLKADGAPFYMDGSYINEDKSTAGAGSAICSCGWNSDVEPTRKARIVAHKVHKTEFVSHLEDMPGDSPEDLIGASATETPAAIMAAETTEENTMARKNAPVDDLIGLLPKASTKKAAPKKAPAKAVPKVAETKTPKKELTGSLTGVEYTGPKHFWAVLSSLGVEYVEGQDGISGALADTTTQSVSIAGTAAGRKAASAALKRVWAGAVEAFNVARKDHENLKRTSSETPEAYKARWAATRDFFATYVGDDVL